MPVVLCRIDAGEKLLINNVEKKTYPCIHNVGILNAHGVHRGPIGIIVTSQIHPIFSPTLQIE